MTPPRAWATACGALALASAAFWLAAGSGWLLPQNWIWHADGWPRAPWTLLTGALVHFQAPHWLGNLLALGAVAVLGAALGATGRDALALLVAWPLGTLALLLWPEVGGYWGLSGPIHAGVAVLALRALREPGTRWLGRLLMAGLVFKLGLEAGWANPVGFNDAWGFNVVYAAHLTGAAAGLATALVLGWLPSASRRNS
ncbi:MAG TPA: rhomboid family intramembrane serine protease [Ottowia sp.]|nr:rhomboid family intramembrane serine protease [Ottowia sp.]